MAAEVFGSADQAMVTGEILLVEDNAGLREDFKEMLEGLGYRVVVAQDGKIALDIIRANPTRFAGILTDLNMPRISGIALTRALADLRVADVNFPNIPVILMSGDFGAGDTASKELYRQAASPGDIKRVISKDEAFGETLRGFIEADFVHGDNAMVTRRVLVVDDEASVGNVARRILERAGYQVTVVSSAAEAREQLSQQEFVLVLSDIVMPDETGFSLADHVVRNHPGIKVQLMSGYYEGAPSAEVAGSSDYLGILAKPFTIVQLKGAVEGAIGPADGAQLAQDQGPVGGIDLNPALLDLQIKRDDKGIPLPMNQQPIQQMHIEGFIPIIINVTPVTNLPLLLGLGGEEEENEFGLNPDVQAKEPEKVSLLN